MSEIDILRSEMEVLHRDVRQLKVLQSRLAFGGMVRQSAVGGTTGAQIAQPNGSETLWQNAAGATRVVGDVVVRSGGANYDSEVLADAPAAFYKMNEASGQPQDSSGNAQHTTVTFGAPGYGLAGKIATAIQFFGAEAFTAPDSATLDFPTPDLFSIELWARKLSDGVEEVLIDKGTNGYMVEFSAANLFRVAKQNVAFIVAATLATLADGLFHQYVWTKNVATNKLYIDGVDVTGGVANQTIAATAVALNIGRSTAPDRYFTGLLDAISLYPTELSAARVLAHYAAANATGGRTFKTTTTVADQSEVGVITSPASVPIGAEARVRHSGYTPLVNTTGVVAIGDYLVTSGTAGLAQSAGSIWRPGVFGVALGTSAGGTSAVSAYIFEEGIADVHAFPFSATQSITAVGNQIIANARNVQIDANANYTLNSTPTVPSGVDGQRVRIMNVDAGADTVTIQDQGTLANSNLRLAAATIAIAPRQSIELTFNGVVNDWVQTGPLVAVI